MEYLIKTLDILENVMKIVAELDPGQQPSINEDLGDLELMRQQLKKACGAESSDESGGLHKHGVTVNEGSEFLSVGVAVCPYFDKCINNGKNEYCDLQTFQEIDCFIGQTER